jgi:hypothetical protein
LLAAGKEGEAAAELTPTFKKHINELLGKTVTHLS